MGIKEIKDQARATLHGSMSYPALYTAPGSSAPIDCNVRLHITSHLDMGAWQQSDGFAVMAEQPTKVVFLRSEVVPERGGVVELGDGTKYRVDRPLPAYGITQTAEVVEL